MKRIKELPQRDFYNFYIEEVNIKIKSIETLINENSSKMQTIYELLNNRSSLITKVFNIDFQDFISMLYDNKIENHIDKLNILKNDIPLILEWIHALQIYNRRNYKLLQSKSNIASKILTSKQLFQVLKILNNRSIEIMLEDGISPYYRDLGSLKINKLKRNYNCKNIDWKASNTLKAELIKQGFTPKDKDNPNGIDWILKYEEDYFYYVNWARSKQHDFFKDFVFSTSNYYPNVNENLEYSKSNTLSIERLSKKIKFDRISDISMGLTQKLYFTIKNCPNFIINYKPIN